MAETRAIVYVYDALYRTTAVTNEDGTTTAYAYDANGNRLSITYPDGKAVTTVYDALGNAASITDHDGTGVVYTRDAEGRVTKEAYSDGSSTEYDYNAAGQLVQQKEVTPEHVTRRQTTYAYDDAGNLTSENRAGVGIAPADEFARYWYDAAGQLIKTTLEGAATDYAYDLAGNLLSDGESTYTYDVQNRLLTKTSADGTVSYTYDAAGNLVSDGSFTYTYDAQNRLVRGENADGESSTYTYNALGARVENVQVRKNGNAGHANAALTSGSRFARDYTAALSDNRATWQRVWETEVGTVVQNDYETVTKHYVVDYLSVANRDILVTEDGSFTQRYVYDAAGKRLSVELDYAPGTARGEAGENPASDVAVNGVGKAWFRTSALNSTLFAVDADGAVVAHMIYDPWGRALLETYTDANFSGLDNLNNFTGYAWDETLGLYYAQNRFYDAATHRFTQEDAVKDGGNWYAYCGNSPLNYVDPLGEAMRSLMKLAGEYGASITWKSGTTTITCGSTEWNRCVESLYNAAYSEYAVSSVKLTATVELNGSVKTYSVAGGFIDGSVYVVRNNLTGYDVVMSDISFAHDWNRAYNTQFESSIAFDAEGYITNQNVYPFTSMRYGLTTMDGVACELIAIFNALNKVKYHTSLSRIADYFEHNPGMWLNGYFGTNCWRAGDYFQKECCGFIDAERVTLAEIEGKLTETNACILSFWNPNFNGMHTVMVEREGDKFVAYNFAGNSPTKKNSIAELLNYNDKRRYFVCAYIISNRLLAEGTVSV